MKIALGSDHRGVETVAALVDALRADGHETAVLGECSGASCDYPDQSFLVGRAVAGGDADAGVLVCGSGIGVSMSANKVPGIRQALACDADAATASRRHNDANVLCLAGDRLKHDEAVAVARAFLDSDFEGGRHARRVNKMSAIERGEDPAAASCDERATPA